MVKWKNHADEMRLMRKRRCFKFRKLIKELIELGFEVREVAPSKYRINDMLDIYPADRKYYNLMTKEAGDLRGVDLRTFIKKSLGIANYQ